MIALLLVVAVACSIAAYLLHRVNQRRRDEADTAEAEAWLTLLRSVWDDAE